MHESHWRMERAAVKILGNIHNPSDSLRGEQNPGESSIFFFNRKYVIEQHTIAESTTK
jgi:hypothetical protein